MPSINILCSEAAYLELVLRLKEKRLKRAAKLIELAEMDVQEAIDAIVTRAEVERDTVRGTPRLLRDADGRPARLAWRDTAKPRSDVVEGSVNADSVKSTEVKT